ncbi:hypothetical protein [Bacteroides congonensis]
MKKIWFMMLMICAVGVFMACSNDDDENMVVNPVSGVSVPATGKIGNEVIIRGTGFTASDIAIYLENTEKDRFKMEASFNNAGASFSVPFTVAVGTYSVVLVQGTSEWVLGTITLNGADNPVMALLMPDTFVAPGTEVLLGGNGYEAGDKLELLLENTTPIEISAITITDSGLQFTVPVTCTEGEYVVNLVRGVNSWELGKMTVQKVRRVKSIAAGASQMGLDVTLNLSYDAEGRLSSIVSEDGMRWDLSYGKNLITTASALSGTPLEYILDESGKVTKASAVDAFDDTETYNMWTYEGDYLNSIVNTGESYEGLNLENIYEKGDLVNLDAFQITYEYGKDALKVAPNTIEPGIALQLATLLMAKEDAAIAFLCGITGKTSGKVPTEMKVVSNYTPEGEPIYITQSITSSKEGEVLKMVTEGYQAEITYEVAE